MAKYRTASPKNLFEVSVNEALKHLHDAAWLGSNSPLATPYFLGSYLQKANQPETSEGRGTALKHLIFTAADSIWPGELPQSQQALRKLVEEERLKIGNDGSRYLFFLLELRYLRRYYPPNSRPNRVGKLPNFLSVSETRFFIHLRVARQRLTHALLMLIRPSLRLEKPTLAAHFVGRSEMQNKCLSQLHSQKSVTLSGVGGIGKSALGAAIANAWSINNVFWYTFQPGLNDDLGSILFSLAHFLNSKNASSLWLQLIAQDGKIHNIEQSLGFLRDDLTYTTQQILLCFDEVDLLHTATIQPRHGVHKQILELLQGLKGLGPLLLIGQRGLIDTDAHYVLQSLSRANIKELTKQLGIKTKDSDLQRIQRLTDGNPRLLELCVNLHINGMKFADLKLHETPSIKPLFNRLWKRLDTSEKQSLSRLSVFRSFVPVNILQDNPGYQNLQKRNLLKLDTQGGVTLLPIIRQLIYDELSSGQRRQYHQHAASIRAEHGQQTEATFHLWQSGEIDAAIELWYNHQEAELQQGKAGAAHALFNNGTVPQNLSEKNRKRLRIIQNRLNLLYGNVAEVLEGIDSYSWHLDDEFAADTFSQWGEASLIAGDDDGALAYFENAISALAKLSTQVTLLHRRRGQIFIERGDNGSAAREALLAQYEAERLKGQIEHSQGQYIEAQEHFQTALKIAEQVSDDARMAKASHTLAMSVGNAGNISSARQYAKLALEYYERIGDRVQLEGLRAELAGMHLNVGQFTEVIEPSEKALHFFKKIKHDLWIGHLSSNLAEAYFETGKPDLAEKYAMQAIHTENPRVQPYACYTLGLVHHSRGNLSLAGQTFARGIKIAEQIEDMFIKAYLYRAWGKIVSDTDKAEIGARKIRKALKIFMELGLQHEIKLTRNLLESPKQIGAA